MARKLVDLSIPITNDIISDPEQMRPQVTYLRHHETVPSMAVYFPGLTADDLPDREGWAVERVTLSTHNGTHMDAPWHFHSTTDQALAPGGRPAPGIDEGPLEYFLQAGVKLDFRHFEDGYVATADDVEAELDRIGHELQPLDIVLVNTAAGAAYGDPN